MVKIKQSTLTTLFVLAILVLVGYIIFTATPQTTYQPQPQPQPQPGYTPFPLGSLVIYPKDKANPTASFTTATVKGKVFSIDTPDSAIASPVTAYLDVATLTSGKLSFSGGKIYTNNAYKVKIWDDSSSPTWYPILITVNVPALDPSLGAAAQYTAPDVYLEKIGTIADPMQENAVGAGGGSLPTGVYSSHTSNKVTINVTEASGLLTIRFTVVFANTVAGSYLKNVVLRPIQDTTSGIPVTAFTAATLIHKEGSNFNAPSDILSYISAQQPISLGDWSGGTSGVYYLTVTIDESSLSAGQKFYFRIDDQGNWLATDPIAGQTGAAAQYFYIEVVS